MRIAEAAACLFLISFALHWTIWRIRIPHRQSAALLAIFFGVLPIGLAALLVSPSLRALGPWGFWPCVHIAVCQISGGFGYVVFYSVFEATSPTLRALLYVHAAGESGRAREQVISMIKRATSMQVKLDAMLRDHMLSERDGAYQLAPKGRLWAGLFSRGRRLLGMRKGG
jgi:hypothetical protein